MRGRFSESRTAGHKTDRVADLLRTHHFRSGEELETTLLRCAGLYNHHLPQKALGHVSPVQAMKNW